MVATCDACDARKWVGEGVNCCKDGDLVMERFPEPPEFLRQLLLGLLLFALLYKALLTTAFGC